MFYKIENKNNLKISCDNLSITKKYVILNKYYTRKVVK